MNGFTVTMVLSGMALLSSTASWYYARCLNRNFWNMAALAKETREKWTAAELRCMELEERLMQYEQVFVKGNENG